MPEHHTARRRSHDGLDVLLIEFLWHLKCFPRQHGWTWHVLLQVRLRILQRSMVIVGSAEGLKRVFQTNQRNYVKDLDFSFHPFLPILGTGLVTAQGKLWQQQRLLMAPTLRVDVLDDVVRPLTRDFICELCV